MEKVRSWPEKVEISPAGVRVVYLDGGAFRVTPAEVEIESIQFDYEFRRNEWEFPRQVVAQFYNLVTVTYPAKQGLDRFVVSTKDVILERDRDGDLPFGMRINYRRENAGRYLYGLGG